MRVKHWKDHEFEALELRYRDQVELLRVLTHIGVNPADWTS